MFSILSLFRMVSRVIYSWTLAQGYMGSHDANTHQFIYHKHQYTFTFKMVFEVFGVTGEIEMICSEHWVY